MQDLTSGNIYKKFFVFSVPIVLSGLLAQAYSTVDTVMIGWFLGEDGIAAIGSTASLIIMLSAIVYGFITGGALYIANLFGSGDKATLINSIKLMCSVTVILAVSLSVISIVFKGPIFTLLKIEDAIESEAFAYYGIYMAGYVFNALSYLFTAVMCAMGNSLLPLAVSSGSGILNVLLNYVLIRVIPLGVAGAAIATVVSTFASVVAFTVIMISFFKKSGESAVKFSFDKKAFSVMLKYGLPCMIQQGIMYLSGVIIQPSINILGTSEIAGYTIGIRLYNIDCAIFQNSTKSIANHTAQCMGAKKYGRLKKGLGVGILQSMLFGLPLAMLCIIFPVQAVSLFFADGKSGGIIFAARYLSICMPFLFFTICNNAFHSFYKAVRAMKTVVISTTVQSVVLVLVTMLTVDSLSITGIYIAIVASWAAEFIFAVSVFFSGKWKNTDILAYEAVNVSP